MKRYKQEERQAEQEHQKELAEMFRQAQIEARQLDKALTIWTGEFWLNYKKQAAKLQMEGMRSQLGFGIF